MGDVPQFLAATVNPSIPQMNHVLFPEFTTIYYVLQGAMKPSNGKRKTISGSSIEVSSQLEHLSSTPERIRLPIPCALTPQGRGQLYHVESWPSQIFRA
jgi:hypothetical protein